MYFCAKKIFEKEIKNIAWNFCRADFALRACVYCFEYQSGTNADCALCRARTFGKTWNGSKNRRSVLQIFQ